MTLVQHRLFPCLLALAAGCSEEAATDAPPEPLPLVATYPLTDIDDASGIDVFEGLLYIVGDTKTEVEVWTTSGARVETVETGVRTALPDIEGIAIVADGEFILAHEGEGALMRSRPTEQPKIRLEGSLDGNNGLEGVCVRRSDGHIFAAKESKPSILYELDAAGVEVGRVTLDIDGDVAGLTHLGDPACPDQLLAVNQEQREVMQLTSAGEVLRRWTIDASRPEGLAYDGGSRLYVVDEARADLIVFAFEGGCL